MKVRTNTITGHVKMYMSDYYKFSFAINDMYMKLDDAELELRTMKYKQDMFRVSFNLLFKDNGSQVSTLLENFMECLENLHTDFNITTQLNFVK